MAQQREAIADRLVSIIATIKLERKSGQLWVRRGEGLSAEEGMLIFTQGQITRANVGRRSGADALNWLSTWGRTHYLFLSIDSTSEGDVLASFLTLSAASSGSREIHTDRLTLETSAGSVGEKPSPAMTFHEAMEQIDKASLSRVHRRLYLLINGQRSIDDLVFLLGKESTEVHRMLHDLEELSIVRRNAPLSGLQE